MLTNIYMKFRDDSLNGFQVIEQIIEQFFVTDRCQGEKQCLPTLKAGDIIKRKLSVCYWHKRKLSLFLMPHLFTMSLNSSDVTWCATCHKGPYSICKHRRSSSACSLFRAFSVPRYILQYPRNLSAGNKGTDQPAWMCLSGSTLPANCIRAIFVHCMSHIFF